MRVPRKPEISIRPIVNCSWLFNEVEARSPAPREVPIKERREIKGLTMINPDHYKLTVVRFAFREVAGRFTLNWNHADSGKAFRSARICRQVGMFLFRTSKKASSCRRDMKCAISCRIT